MVTKPTEILIVDDEAEIREILRAALSFRNYRCVTAENGAAAFELLRRRPFDIVLSDIAMPEMDGMELLSKAKALRPEIKVILITGFGTLEWAKQAIRQGAFDYLEKPFELDDVRRVVDQAQLALRVEAQTDVDTLRTAPPQRDTLTGLLNHRYFCEALTRLRSLCRRQHHPLSVMLVDVDRFGKVNRDHGHAVGDLVLRDLSQQLVDTCRASDVVARYGGDQFAIALPETDGDAAVSVAKRCCQRAQMQRVGLEDAAIECSVSVGVAECETGFIESESDLLRRAEDALAHAKANGGGCVTRWPVDGGIRHIGGNGKGRSSDADKPSDAVRADEQSLRKMSEDFRRLQHQLRQTCLESTRALVAAVEAKEPLTERHSMNVATYCETLGQRMGLMPAMIETLKVAATLHDIGKIGVPDSVLNKAGKLTDDEFELIKRHPAMGVHILERASFLRAELPMILHHHERWDGKGYPAGLSGSSIPLGARVLHVADSIDAMFSMRSYKEGYTAEQVKRELEAGRAGQFDPQVVDVALAWLTECPDEIIYPDDAAQLADEDGDLVAAALADD